jgi:dipeptidyl aminopeptidase/acylaminoacyl peptidase
MLKAALAEPESQELVRVTESDGRRTESGSGLPAWTRRFEHGYPIAVRRALGTGDLSVLINQGADGFSLSVWDGRTRELRAVDYPGTTFMTTVTADGRWILDLLDPTGSEVGHLHATPVEGGAARNLTPGFEEYVVRGIDVSADGRFVILTTANALGFSVWQLDLDLGLEPRLLFRSEAEAWLAIPSADGSLVAVETTDHCPGVRRFAVTVIDAASGEIAATLSDGPDGPVRRVAFSAIAGDSRLLVSTERSGFARPAIWDPVTGARYDVELGDRDGDVIALDWDAVHGHVLMLHVDRGLHRLLEHDLASGQTRSVPHPPGAYADFDVADHFPEIFSSHYALDGALRLVRSRWDTPIHILEARGTGAAEVVLPPASVPPGASFESHDLVSTDGTHIQLWVGRPAQSRPLGAVLEMHGGPNLVTVDRYDPAAQAWIDAGYMFASLNYRGSVTFGRDFREGFWGQVGDREIEDTATAVAWLTSAGGVDPAAIFITGASYGGFMTLLSLGRLPELFAGGLAHVALADWVTAYDDMTPALRVSARTFIGADLGDDPGRWRRASPISYVGSVRAPAWLNQGAHDTRTPPVQAQRYADALRAAGGDVLIEMFDGGHMPGGLAALRHDQARMLELAGRALRGEPWSGGG